MLIRSLARVINALISKSFLCQRTCCYIHTSRAISRGGGCKSVDRIRSVYSGFLREMQRKHKHTNVFSKRVKVPKWNSQGPGKTIFFVSECSFSRQKFWLPRKSQKTNHVCLSARILSSLFHKIHCFCCLLKVEML